MLYEVITRRRAVLQQVAVDLGRGLVVRPLSGDAFGHLLLWQRLEAAKHRLIYGLLRLNLPVTSQFVV